MTVPNFDQLKKAVEWSVRQLATPRKNRVAAIRQYVGSHYGDNGAERRVPTNFLELAVTIYTRQLAARAPRAMITAGSPELKPYAKSMEIAINQIPEEIDLAATLRKSVIEAMFCFAIVKVGIYSSGKAILGHDYGQSFVDLVSIDDYFCDMSATSRKAMQYEGNDYWLSRDDVLKMYSGPADDIKADDHTVQGAQGEQRAEGVTTDEGADLYAEKVWLRDVWIPAARQVVTYGVKSGKLIRTVSWDGPHEGPYHILSYSDVPGNLLPLPPVALWIDLHDLGNSLFRKVGRQADAKKTVAAFQGGNDSDVERLKRAADGEGIVYSGQKPESITVGGIDAPTLAFYIQIRDLFSYFAGNLDSLGGLGPQSETIGQDKLLSEAASSRLKQMAERTVDFAVGIFEALAWYEWTDPVKVRHIEKEIPGMDMSVRSEWSAQTRQGDFEDYDFDIDVYSMQDDSPSTKLQKIGAALERFVFPILPSLEQQGGKIDFQELVALIARLGNIPELNDIVRFQSIETMGMQPPAGGASAEPGMPVNTTRNYVRSSRPGATRAGKDDVMARLLMGGTVQGSEAARMGRVAG